MIELSGGDTCGLLDLISVGKTLPGERIATEEPPPAFLEVQPTGPFRDENVVEAGMLGQPGASLGTIVARKVVGDHKNVTDRMVGFNVSKQSDLVGRVA